MGIFDRLGAMGNTDVGGALAGAHEHFQKRINTHGHFGRALIETIAETCRNHPNLVGIFVGVMVEQFLVHEKHHHEHELAEQAEAERNGHAPAPHPAIPLPRAAPNHTPHHLLRFAHLRPFRMSMEVFGALVLLKFSTGMAHLFQRRKHRGTLGAVARIRLFSGTFATYYTAKALKSHEVSSLRNGLAMFFATRALKPLLRPDYRNLPPEPPKRPAPAAGFSLEPEMHPPAEPESRMVH
jgi:hypothetical protein